ncbi:MAG: DUF1289 domain-containing protein [Chromatiales bacterium]|nr:DUF1289 domain-containing protein [Chromatiales bacterium]
MSSANTHVRPMSPCVNICTIADNGSCMGCRRTVPEIKSWAKLSPEEQWALVAELRKREPYSLYK